MMYRNVVKGHFIERKNRFIAEVSVNGIVENVHIKNTGRCKELFLPETEVYLCPSDNASRKTKYDLVAVKKQADGALINVDSQAPNRIAEEWLTNSGSFSDSATVRREVKYKNSRFDLYVEDGEKRCFIEVKGVTLEMDGVALFPDAPTERGVKHLNELVAAINDGYEAMVIFVIKMKGVTAFAPNRVTHPQFADALLNAKLNGVKIIALDCLVSADTVVADKPVPTLI